MDALLDSDPLTVSGYTLHSRLGEGAYGVVYAASHARFGRVALKVLRPTLANIPQVRARLRAEAQALQRVQGNCTAAVLEVNADAPVPYLALELVEGLNLFQYVGTHGPFKGPILEALKDGLVEALASVHAANLVHRDLKPTNIMYGPAGVKVLDFGISVLLEVAASTGTDITLGTETWMSPEQAQGDPVRPASDVFNLGMVLAYAATGVHPFGAGKPAALVYRVVHEMPNLAGVPNSVLAFVAQCLQKDALQRPELRMHAVGEWPVPPTVVDLGTGVLPVPIDEVTGGSRIFWSGYRLGRRWRRWRTIFLPVLGVGLILEAVMISFLWGRALWQLSPAQSAAVEPTATAAVVPTAIRVVVRTATTDSRRNGQGTETYADGTIYTGGFKDGKRNGQGTLTYADGTMYTGEWKDGKPNGQGTYTYADATTYSYTVMPGDYLIQLANRFGTTYAELVRLNNLTRTVLESGQVLVVPGGTGGFKDGKRNGQGTYAYADGTTYGYTVMPGDSLSRLASRFGTTVSEMIRVNNLSVPKVGQVLVVPGGAVGFKDGKHSGQGTGTYADGSTYTGEWKDGKPNGLGIMKYRYGRTYIGGWNDGKLVP